VSQCAAADLPDHELGDALVAAAMAIKDGKSEPV
jgi:hypothetical protein